MHANYFETSVMLHIHPQAVHMDRAVSQQDRDSRQERDGSRRSHVRRQALHAGGRYL